VIAPVPAGPTASIVIRAYNEADAIQSVLGQVLAQEGAGSLEVIVIDSGSHDGTLDIVRRFPVRLERIAPGAFTFGGALNRGARLAHGVFCVNLSAHCVPRDRRWLTRLLAPLAQPGVVATYGRQIPIPGVNPFEEIELRRVFPAGPLAEGARQYFSNANCAIRRDLLLARPFDETIPIMEDHLWLLERRPGERVVYVPEAEVFHSHPLRLRYWYRRYRKLGLAYRYIETRRGVDLLPERSCPTGRRLRGLLAEASLAFRELTTRGYWRHTLTYPSFCLMREIALRQGLRRGAAVYATPAPQPPE
jgi:rhamnosyltransferase